MLAKWSSRKDGSFIGDEIGDAQEVGGSSEVRILNSPDLRLD